MDEGKLGSALLGRVLLVQLGGHEAEDRGPGLELANQVDEGDVGSPVSVCAEFLRVRLTAHTRGLTPPYG